MVNIFTLAIATYHYRKASQKVEKIEAELDQLFKAKEFEKRHLIIKQWSNACVKRNKLQKTALKELNR